MARIKTSDHEKPLTINTLKKQTENIHFFSPELVGFHLNCIFGMFDV